MASLAKIIVTFPLLLSLAHANINMEKCPDKPEPSTEADCSCNSLQFVSYFSSVLTIALSREQAHSILIARIEAFKCFEFYKLPKHLEILMPDSVPIPYQNSRKKFIKRKKFHRRIKRQVSLGYPTNDKWETIIPQLPRKGRHHYAPLGTHVILKCFASHDDNEVGVQEEVVGDASSFSWKHVNGMEITAPLSSVDKKTGDLTFHRVRLADSSIYNCTVTSQPDTGGDTRTTSYLSQLDVITGSTFWLRFGMTFATDKCRHKELVVIQQHVPDWVHQYVCHFCPVRNVSLTCMNIEEAGENEKYVQLTVAISTLGFEELLTSWSKDHVNCNMECQKRMHAKVLNVTSVSILKLFSRRIEVRSIDGPTSVYRHLPNSHDEDLADACPPGFFLTYSLCFPCAPGTYSPTGPAECFPCHKGFFQPNPGSSACFHCPSERTTRKVGSLSQTECFAESEAGFLDFFANNLLMTMIVGGVLGLLLFLWCIICCCCPRTRCGKLLRCVPCCGEGDDGEDKQIYDENRKLTGETTSESDSEMTSRSSRRVEFSDEVDNDGGYSSNEPDFRAERSVQELIETTEEEIYNPTITLSSSAITLPEPGRLDLEKYAHIQPMWPDPPEYRGRHEYCQTTLRNQQKQRKEEEEEARRRLASQRQTEEESQDGNSSNLPSSSQQAGKQGQKKDRSRPAPAFPRDDGDQPDDGGGDVSESSQESSGTKRYFARHPHLRLGNILHKSKSLVAKLAEQKRKLRHFQPDSSTESTKSSKSPSRRKLLDKPKQPLTALKRKLKDKNVTISESRNTFHPKSIADTLPRTASKSEVKSKDEVVKSRSKISQKESKTKGIATSLSKHEKKSRTKRDKELIPEKSKPSSRTTVLTRGMTTDRFQETMKKMQDKEAGSLRSFSKSKKRKK